MKTQQFGISENLINTRRLGYEMRPYLIGLALITILVAVGFIGGLPLLAGALTLLVSGALVIGIGLICAAIPYRGDSAARREASSKAQANYDAARQNGTSVDNPTYTLPHDGIYTMESPDKHNSKIRYTEGQGDRTWMEEKDKKYIIRLLHKSAAGLELINEEYEDIVQAQPLPHLVKIVKQEKFRHEIEKAEKRVKEEAERITREAVARRNLIPRKKVVKSFLNPMPLEEIKNLI